MSVLETGFKKNVEVQLQTETAECGLACLAMIATAYGHETDLRLMRQRFSTSLMGTTLEQLIAYAGNLGFITRALRLELNELSELALPCILHFDMNHFVVLDKVTSSKFQILDPAYGVRTVSHQDLSLHFTGVALELLPTVKFNRQKKVRNQAGVLKLLGLIRGLGSALVKIFFLSATIELFTLLVPLLNQWAIDEAVVSGDVHLLYTIIFGFTIAIAMHSATELLREFALLHIGAVLNLHWFTRVFSRLINLPISYFEKRQIGDVIARADTVTTIQMTLSNGLIAGIIDGFMAAFTFMVMLAYSLKLSLLSAGVLSLYILMRAAIYKAIRSATESQFVFTTRLQTYLLETIRGIQTIKLFGRENSRMTAIVNRSVRSRNAGLKYARYGIIFRAANAFLFRIETITVLAIAGSAIIDKSFTIGMFFAFTSFREQFARRIVSLVDKFFEFRMLSVQTDRLADIMLEKPEDFTQRFEMPAVAGPCALVIKNLSFRYAEGLPYIISNIDLKFEEGEHVAIVGPSGCGKTTLLKILTGLCRPTSGTIYLGDIPVTQIGAIYREMCATVTQEDVLFAGSIAENITFFHEHPNTTLVKRCAIMAGIDDEIIKMPMGYDTLVGDMGSTLSGGQKQRVLLARALYKKPRILFLDEATSHLDPAKEMEILGCLSSLKMTRIVIAHRQETIKAADRIIDISNLH